MRSLGLALLLMIAPGTPLASAQELDSPAEDDAELEGGDFEGFDEEASDDDAPLGPAEALAAIDALERRVDAIDTVTPSALLVSGIALAVLGAGGVAGTTALFVLDAFCKGECAIPGAVGGVMLLTGLTLLTIGAATLPTLNGRRSRLQRRMDDYRRFLPDARRAWIPLLWADAQGGGVGVRVAF